MINYLNYNKYIKLIQIIIQIEIYHIFDLMEGIPKCFAIPSPN